MNRTPYSSTPKNEIAVVIDAFSSGIRYLHELQRRGIHVIHVISRKSLIDSFGAPPSEFQTVVCANGDDAIDEILQINPQYIFCGSEPGVDIIGSLPLPQTSRLYNPPLKSQIFVNKYTMCNALKSSGMNVIPHVLCDDLSVALAFYESHGPKIVIKPVDSAGADGVIICSTEYEVRDAFEKLINCKNILCRRNFNLIAQKFIDGQQYIVNGILQNREVCVLDIWRDNREMKYNVKMLDYEEALSPFDNDYLSLKRYAVDCISRLEYQNGPFHMELIVDSSSCYMIETGFRVMGSLSHEAYQRMFGNDLVRMHVEYALDGTSSNLNLSGDGSHFCVTLRSFKSGILVADLGSFARALQTYCGDYGLVAKGSPTSISHSLFDSLGTVYLSGKSESVWLDYHKLREFERTAVGSIEEVVALCG